MIATVYKIQSTRSRRKCYIGVTAREPEKRWYEHQRELLTDRHHNQKLQRYYNKYGDVFEYEVVEQKEVETDIEMLDLERKYIAKYNAFDNGFNLTRGGMGANGWINPNRAYDYEFVQMLLKINFFTVYDLKLIQQDFGISRQMARRIMSGEAYSDIKLSFDSYEDYINHKNLAERYRFPDLGDKINYLYKYMKNNNELQIPRKVRQMLRPESLKGSYLKDDYMYKDKIHWILKTVEKNKALVQKQKSDECLLVLNELLSCNNSVLVAKKLNMKPKRVDMIKNGHMYKKFHTELRDKVKSLPLYKEGRFYEVSRERLIYTLWNTASFKEAAEILNVKDYNISNWCKVHNLPRNHKAFVTLNLN